MEESSMSHAWRRKKQQKQVPSNGNFGLRSTKMVSTTSSVLVGDLHPDIARIMMLPGTSFYMCLGCNMLPRDETLVNASHLCFACCEGVGVVKRVHTLLGGVHRLATALKEVEEVQEEVQETKDEWEDEEEEEDGGLKVEEKRSSHAWMR